jgi:hypothetical protein
MRYGLTSSTAVNATSKLARFASNNGNTFTPTGANEIRIRIKGDGFMAVAKHYVQFTVSVATADAFVDTHSGSFFDRVTIENQGAIIEQINSYGLYNAIRQNYNASLDDVLKTNVQSGAGKLGVKQALGAFGQAATNSTADIKTASDAFLAASNGLNLNVNKSALGQSIASGQEATFTIQLESGLLKNHHEKALPDGLSEIELVLRLASDAQAMVGDGAATYTISNPAFFCPIYMIQNADVMASYRNVMASEGVMISGDTAKTYINSIPAAAITTTLQINDRSISCKGLVTAIRLADADATPKAYSNGSFGITNTDNTRNASSYKYVIGGVNYPQSDVKINPAVDKRDLGRFQEEALKALAKHGEHYANSLVSTQQLTGKLGKLYASVTDTGAFDVPRALVCVSLTKFSDDGLRMVGLNTSQNSSPNVLELELSTAIGSATTATTYSICEAFYQIDRNGGLTVAV